MSLVPRSVESMVPGIRKNDKNWGSIFKVSLVPKGNDQSDSTTACSLCGSIGEGRRAGYAAVQVWPAFPRGRPSSKIHSSRTKSVYIGSTGECIVSSGSLKGECANKFVPSATRPRLLAADGTGNFDMPSYVGVKLIVKSTSPS